MYLPCAITPVGGAVLVCLNTDYEKREQLSAEEEDARADAKRKMLGNIRFIGKSMLFCVVHR